MSNGEVATFVVHGPKTFVASSKVPCGQREIRICSRGKIVRVHRLADDGRRFAHQHKAAVTAGSARPRNVQAVRRRRQRQPPTRQRSLSARIIRTPKTAAISLPGAA